MMRRCIQFALSASTTLVASASAQADSSWRIHNAAAAVALRAGDQPRASTELLALERQVGATPRLATRLAALAFAAGDTVAARRWVRALAAMGTAVDSTVTQQYAASFGTAALDSIVRGNAALKTPIGDSRQVLRLDDPDMISEDVSYDRPRHRFLVSSVRRGIIYSIDAIGGSARVFAHPDTAGIWGIFALGVDTIRRTLWASTAAFPGSAKYTRADSAKSALLEFDLETGTLRRRLVPHDSGPHALGDLTVGPDGAVYLGDGFGGGVYRLRTGADSLEILIPPRTLGSPQTPVVGEDGSTLYVPDYVFGLVVVDLVTGHWRWMQHPDSVALNGIDGLYRSGHDLIAVQNGLDPNRIVRLGLDRSDRLVRYEVVLRGGAATDLTHAALVGNTLYFIAQSGWDRVDDDGTMRPGTKLEAPALRQFSMPAAVHR